MKSPSSRNSQNQCKCVDPVRRARQINLFQLGTRYVDDLAIMSSAHVFSIADLDPFYLVLHGDYLEAACSAAN